ncbi:twin-arginine translocation pathway signal protein [Candidatus Thiodiazotropha endoloripes]|uniref:nitrous oxide reductase accessory protein NosL n=1 Tax=Candidatus Thiodiazotropha endoloripes TaxID=1818881 RepID=UPI00083D6FEA|nr:nitrous oxide reductase accessory protein NosL [Candidatus Thiodiazotropha endoloripes]ODB94631.1 twin-arginine translocation pathway signal protein [Candidatus Thiodiazotropha endoloripes]
MSETSNKERRNLLKLLSAAGLTGLSGGVLAGQGVGAMVPGIGWVKASEASCDGDGTPLQFIPKKAPDSNPLEKELEKYAKCPYCGMDRTKWHHSRHLVHYDDDLVDATCSIHCLAISLSLNIDRGPKAIYAADYAADDEIKPLINVDQASYLIGAKLKGTMTTRSKMAFGSVAAAKVIQAEKGGALASFDEALSEAYAGMAKDTLMVRKKRSERRRKMMQKMKQQKG